MNVVIVVDMLNGFLRHGHLSSSRLAALIPSVREFVEAELATDAEAIFLVDTHRPDDLEFRMFPSHCVAGSGEDEIVDELKPLAERCTVVRKTRYSGFYNTNLEEVLAALHPEQVHIVGVCTDICVLHTVAGLRDRDYEVIVHKRLVDTFDAPEHEGDAVNQWALGHMQRVLGAIVV